MGRVARANAAVGFRALQLLGVSGHILMATTVIDQMKGSCCWPEKDWTLWGQGERL